MKTTVKTADYSEVISRPRPARENPIRPNLFWRCLIRLVTVFGMLGTGFTLKKEGMEQLGREPCLILMNHSCFLDLQIAYRALFPRPFCIVCTGDGFVGMGGLMNWLMRHIGCIPTCKFVTDVGLIRDMQYALREKHASVLMFPEASYSFDGRATALPRKMGVLLKKLDVPVVMIETFGAFSRNPLYNELQIRKRVKVSATMRCLYTRQQVRQLGVQELSDGLDEAFSFDHFRWQKEQGLLIEDPFRADGLSRILFQCAHCGTLGRMQGRGTRLTCGHCGKGYTLMPLGELRADDGQTEFSHIPDWSAWERQCVRQEILDGSYRLDVPVDIAMMVDYSAIYRVGSGRLVHDSTGFHLTGCDGRLEYHQKPQSCYGLYADYYWYEIADVICIGINDTLYYCFPKGGDVVARTRIAAEEMYKLYKARRLPSPAEAV